MGRGGGRKKGDEGAKVGGNVGGESEIRVREVRGWGRRWEGRGRVRKGRRWEGSELINPLTHSPPPSGLPLLTRSLPSHLISLSSPTFPPTFAPSSPSFPPPPLPTPSHSPVPSPSPPSPLPFSPPPPHPSQISERSYLCIERAVGEYIKVHVTSFPYPKNETRVSLRSGTFL